MKRLFAVCMVLCLLTGCGGETEITPVLAFREKLLSAQGCTFRAEITADYAEEVHRFAMDCKTDPEGNLQFTVLEPESIQGITGTIAATGGKLSFTDTVLGFPLLADGQFSPVSSPWILCNTLRKGYLASCAVGDGAYQVTFHDSYAEDALQLDLWLDSDCVPKYGEILWKGRRILSLEVEDFQIL